MLVGNLVTYRRNPSTPTFSVVERRQRDIASLLAERLATPGSLPAGTVSVFTPRTVPGPDCVYGGDDDVRTYRQWRRSPAFHEDLRRRAVHRDALEARRCGLVETARTALRRAGLDETIALDRRSDASGTWIASVPWRGGRVAVGSGPSIDLALQSVPAHAPTVAFALAAL